MLFNVVLSCLADVNYITICHPIAFKYKFIMFNQRGFFAINNLQALLLFLLVIIYLFILKNYSVED